MECLNRFTSLKQDLNKLIPNEDSCLNVLNFRPVTDEGGSTMGMVNIRGNEYALSIPCTSDVWQFTPTIDNIDPTGDNEIEIDIENYTVFALTIGVATSVENLCELITNAINSDPSLSLLGFHAYYYQNSFYLINTLNVYEFNVNGIYYNSEFVPSEGFFIASQCNLKLIGWTKLRDDIYLFTTNSTDENPGGVDETVTADPVSTGQVWKLTYDEQIPLSATSPSLTLIYNNYVNFTNAHPIPQLGGTVGVYENDFIARIYWTDNFNTIRSLNVYDPNAFATPVAVLGLRANINFSLPELHEIVQNGQCKVGIYQLAYRYYNQSGSKTSFFLPSKPIHIVTGSEIGTMTEYSEYEGTSVSSTSDKSIIWKIDDVDQNFEYAEFAVLYRSVFTSIPEIYVTGVRAIGNNATIFYTYTGQDPDRDVTITAEEFVEKSYSFDTAKSITHKNNFLFAANTKSRTFDLDYDAKAFRFTPSSFGKLTYVKDALGNNYLTVPSIPDSSEIINTYNQDINLNQSSTFLSGTSTSLPFKHRWSDDLLGGEGQNIKYKFITRDNLLDNDEDRLSSHVPWRQPESNNPSWGDYKSPYNVQYKGYKRNEIYRFGILFFDKSGNPGFVKWIDDIRMPGIYDLYTAYDLPTTAPTFPLLTRYTAGGKTYVKANQLGVEFEVNIPAAIAKKISGFSIVRVKRTHDDRTILANGCLDTTAYNSTNGTYVINTNAGDGSMGTNNGSAYITNQTDVTFFYSPETLFEQSPTVLPNDCLIPVSALASMNTTNIGTSPTLWKAKMYYHGNVLPNITDADLVTNNAYFKLDNGKTFGPSDNTVGPDGSLSSGEVIWNKVSSGGNVRTIGNKVEVYKIDNSNFDAPTVQSGSLRPASAGTFGKWLCDYYRANLNQYGGSDYYAKTLNQYISTGHYQKVEDVDADQTFTCEVFGGDTVVTAFDYVRSFGYYNTGSAIDIEDFGWVYYFPIESYINTDLRSGYYHNNDGQTWSNSSTTISTYRVPSWKEDFIYNPRYSNENDTLNFFHKSFNSYNDKVFEVHDNRIWASQPKIHGENTDSWTLFKSSDFIDVDGVYGPINNLVKFGDKIIYYQDDAFGVLSSNERVIINDAQNQSVALALGTASVLQRYDYVSTNIGCKHQFGMTVSDSAVYWFDIKNFKHYKFSDSVIPISDIGMSSFFAHNINKNIRITDNPYLRMGITATYDYRFNDVIFTFLDYYTPDDLIRVDKSFTIAYNELINAYSSFYSFTPSVYINDRRVIYTPDSSNVGLYLHNAGEYCKFYGQVYSSKITAVVNPYPTETKIWNNQEITTEAVDNYVNSYDTSYPYISYQEENLIAPDIVDNSFDTIRYYNDYQNTDFQLTSSIMKRKERTWNVQIPRNRVIYNTPNDNIFTSTNLTTGNKPFGERMRSKYLIVDLIYNNNYNYKFTVNTLKTLFEKSYR